MKVAAKQHPAGTLAFVTPGTRASLSRQTAAGRALRLAPGVYAVGASLPPEKVANHHRLEIIARFWPAAVLCDRTALAGGEPTMGWAFVCHPDPPRRAELVLPGLTISPRVGPAPLPGDMPMPAGLYLAGPVRGLVENAVTMGRPPLDKPSRTAGLAAVEDRMEEEARTGGAGRIDRMLHQLDVISGQLSPRGVALVRERLVALLGTQLATEPLSARLSARLSGQPYDEHRIGMLTRLVAYLDTVPPAVRPALGGTRRWQWEPFFEAYYSNFIEGTEFGVEEARRIAVDGEIPVSRPEDAHDVAATYRIAADPTVSAEVPRSGDELLEILIARHADVMAAREDKRPGRFKIRGNYAGGYAFVDPEAIEGTLRRGFDVLASVTDPLHRAVSMMVLLTEVHPFDDGNGRLARLLANAELSAAGQIRIVVPTIYRNNYLAGLVGVSNGAGVGQTLLSVLDFAQRWTAAIDWSSYEAAHADLTSVSAYTDSGVAEASGLRLRLPALDRRHD
jgi:hypothetical protein